MPIIDCEELGFDALLSDVESDGDSVLIVSAADAHMSIDCVS